jgi:hypothetical protein
VEGICPHCGADARGDHCEMCGRALDPVELEEPRCLTCGHTPVIKETTQYFFKLSAFQKDLEEYIETNEKLPANVHGVPQMLARSQYEEDCLYLNVWTPAKSADAKLPVFIWIHGGGMVAGSGVEWVCDGDGFAGRKDIVVVTINIDCVAVCVNLKIVLALDTFSYRLEERVARCLCNFTSSIPQTNRTCHVALGVIIAKFDVIFEVIKIFIDALVRPLVKIFIFVSR